jgi:hypothetical protein
MRLALRNVAKPAKVDLLLNEGINVSLILIAHYKRKCNEGLPQQVHSFEGETQTKEKKID